MPRLLEKTALVSGAARGIGEAIAIAFANEGARIIVTDICDDAWLALAQRLGRDTVYRRLDVRADDDWARVTTEALERFGRLDIVVNNAGITGFESGLAAHDPENADIHDGRGASY